MRFLIILILKLSAVGIAFALLFHFVDLSKVLETLQTANFVLVCSGVLVFLAGQALAAARWQSILRHDAINITLSRTLRMNLIGTFASNFLPGMATGDLAKSALLFRDYPEKRAFLIASVVCDRIFGVIAIFILMILSTSLLGLIRHDWIFVQYGILAGVILILLLWMLVSNIEFERIFRLLPGKLAARCSGFFGDLRRLLRARSLARRTIFLGIGFQLSWAISQWIMLCAISAKAPFLPVLAASTLSLVVALVPISINGLGLREGTFSYTLQQFGIEPQIAVAVALLSLLSILTSSLIGGLLLGLNSLHGKPAPVNWKKEA